MLKIIYDIVLNIFESKQKSTPKTLKTLIRI
jgi:hypothetical protein